MKCYEIYFSPTGGTKKVLDIISSVWDCEKEAIDIMDRNKDFTKYCFGKEDICLVAVPSFGGRVPEIATERLSMMKGNHAKAAAICVYGNRAYEDTLLELKNTLSSASFSCEAGIVAIAEHSIVRKFAAGRPNEEDKEDLISFANKLKEKFSKNDADEIHVPGNFPYKEYKVIPVHSEAKKDCTKCGICAAKCPVGAIDKEHPDKAGTSKCIYCMGCVAVCPQKVRKVNKIIVAAAGQKLKKVCTEPKKNELYI